MIIKNFIKYKNNESIKWYKDKNKFETDDSLEHPEYDDFINDDNFRQFLIDHDAYEEYLLYCNKRHISNHRSDRDVITRTLTWADTSSGRKLWSNLNALWKEEYDKLYGKNESIKWYKDKDKFETDDSIKHPEYDDFINDNNFRQFLIDHDAYEEYIECCQQSVKNNHISEMGIIGKSFTWNLSPSGYDFWLKLHDLWNKKYVELYGENEAIKWYKDKDKFETDDSIKPLEYDDFINDDNFRQFLIQHRAYEEYLNYCYDHHRNNHIASEDIITKSFKWSSTNSGHRFWQNLHELWMKNYNKLYGKNEAIKWYKDKDKFETDNSLEHPEYDDFINDDNFRQFLINNDAYEEYIRYCKKSNRINHEAFPKIIDKSLIWGDTFRKSNFWSNINKMWQEKYYELYGKNEAIKWYKDKDKFEIDNSIEHKDYDDFINDDVFRQFLIDNYAYEEYLEYCTNIMLASKNKVDRRIIDITLVWDDTDDYGFWEDLHELWMKNYDKLYSKNEAIKWYKDKDKFEIDNSTEPENYDDFINDDNFRQFLIDHGVYEEYLTYCFDDFKKNHEATRNIIDSSLNWSSTPGKSIWGKLHSLWRQEYDKNNNLFV